MMEDWQTKGYSKYGASMGRGGGLNVLTTDKLSLRRVPVNSQGYDPGGAYWGIGAPLFCAQNENGDTLYVRAADRKAAKAKFFQARFYR